jgi:hypothetical protein
MMDCRILPLGLCLVLAACAATGLGTESEHEEHQGRKAPAGIVDSGFTLERMGAFIQQTSSQDFGAQRAEATRLQHIPEISASDRLKLAYLLSLENTSQDDLAQSKAMLDGLDLQFADPATRLYVRLLQRTVAAEAAYKTEKQRADELQEKLRQIKKLELDLMERNQAKPAQDK